MMAICFGSIGDEESARKNKVSPRNGSPCNNGMAETMAASRCALALRAGCLFELLSHRPAFRQCVCDPAGFPDPGRHAGKSTLDFHGRLLVQRIEQRPLPPANHALVSGELRH